VRVIRQRRFAVVAVTAMAALAISGASGRGLQSTWSVAGEVTINQVEHYDNGSTVPATHVTWDDTQHFQAHFSFSYSLLANGELSGTGGSSYGKGSGSYTDSSWQLSGQNAGQGAFSCAPPLSAAPFTLVVTGRTTNGTLVLDIQILGDRVTAPEIHIPCGAGFDTEWAPQSEVGAALSTLGGNSLSVGDPSSPRVAPLGRTLPVPGAGLTGTRTLLATLTFAGGGAPGGAAAGGAGGGGAGGGGGGGAAPPPPPPAPTGSLSPPLPRPAAGVSVDVKTVQGTVLVNGRPLVAGEQITTGSTVDATHGTLTLTSVSPTGTLQTANFASGAFKVLKTAPAEPTELSLVGGSFAVCRRQTAGVAASATIVRALWGNGRGQFRTDGHLAAATVRGTIWLTEDRCDGTLILVRRGTVSVIDEVHHTIVIVRAGHSYLT